MSTTPTSLSLSLSVSRYTQSLSRSFFLSPHPSHPPFSFIIITCISHALHTPSRPLDLDLSRDKPTHHLFIYPGTSVYLHMSPHLLYKQKLIPLDKPTSLCLPLQTIPSLPVWLTKKIPGIRPLSSLGSLDGLTPTTGKASLFGLLLLLVSPSLFSVRRGARVGWLIEASQ